MSAPSTSFVRSVRVELLKLRTIRLPLGLLAASTGLVALFAALHAGRAGGPGHMAIAPLDTRAGLTSLVTGTAPALLIAAVLGVTVSAGERRHGTLTATYLASPARRRVVLAKAVAAGLVGPLFGLAAGVAVTGIAVGFVATHDYGMTIAVATLVRYVLGAAVGAGLLAATGVAVGAIVGDQLDATVGVLLWGFLVEQLVGGLFEWLAPWLPFTAATTLAGTATGGSGGPLPFAGALVVVTATAVAAGVLAARRAPRLDVT